MRFNDKNSAFARVNPKDYGRVAVLMGGCSSEREVSLSGGQAVLEGLLKAGVDAFALEVSAGEENMIELLQRQPIDTLFNMLHGGAGENGSLPCLLEFLGVPYTGNSMLASALAMDKMRCKFMWQGMGLPTADFIMLCADTNWQEVAAQLGLPLMVKPANEGSSVGVTKVEQLSQLPAAYALAAKYDDLVMAEKWLGNGEYTVAILKGQALPVIRLVTQREFYDYQAKYIDDDTQYLIPCGLSSAREKEMQMIALQAFDSLGCYGWGRVDLMVDAQDAFHLLEVNTVPGMTSHSLVPMAARALGMDFSQLVLQILSTAKHEQRRVNYKG